MHLGSPLWLLDGGEIGVDGESVEPRDRSTPMLGDTQSNEFFRTNNRVPALDESSFAACGEI